MKMVDLDSMIKTIRVKCLKSLIVDPHLKCNYIPSLYFDYFSIEIFLCFKYEPSFLPPSLPGYYRQCFLAWHELNQETESEFTAKNIKNQFLWFNRYLICKGEPLENKEWYEHGIMYVKDILQENNELMTPDQIGKKYGVSTSNFLFFYKVRQMIPYTWKCILKNSKEKEEETPVECVVSFMFEGKEYKLVDLINKDIYWAYIGTHLFHIGQKLIKYYNFDIFKENTA